MNKQVLRRRALAVLVFLSMCVLSALVTAGNPQNSARSNQSVAMTAADSWADDARLVWIENDSPLQRDGRATSWGYLYYSPAQGKMRSYSVRQGEIRHAENHIVTAAAPGVEQAWKDSPEVVSKAWNQAEDYCEGDCELESMLLVKGIFNDGVTWVAVFSSSSGPRLHVVINAINGKFIRRWRG